MPKEVFESKFYPFETDLKHWKHSKGIQTIGKAFKAFEC